MSKNEWELPAGTMIGQYEVAGRIGSGGMAQVYEALHTGLNKKVAIKTLHRQYMDNQTVVARFLREGQVAARIRHPSVVDVTDVGMIDGLPCLVMEYLEGESLHAYFKREGATELTKLADLMLPIAAAVAAAHDEGIVHRDLKPANIFLARAKNGEIQPKVLDFGISKIVCEPTPSALTTDSTFLGSPHYVSPELARGDKTIGPPSDQYSLGVILYEGACGKRPFSHRADTFMSLMYAIAQGDRRDLSEIKPDIRRDFQSLVNRAMALLPSGRFGSVRELGAALLPFASARSRVIWSPTFSGVEVAPPPASTDVTRVEVPRSLLEETSGTLGQSASEIDSRAATLPVRKGRGLWLAIGALALAGSALTAIMIVRRAQMPQATVEQVNSPNESTPSVAGAALPKPKRTGTYLVDVSVNLEEADIELDGQWVGSNSFKRSLPQDGTKHTLRVSAPDHETVTLHFTDNPPPRKVELLPSDAAQPEAPPPAAEKPARPPRTQEKPAEKPPKVRTDNRDPWAN